MYKGSPFYGSIRHRWWQTAKTKTIFSSDSQANSNSIETGDRRNAGTVRAFQATHGTWNGTPGRFARSTLLMEHRDGPDVFKFTPTEKPGPPPLKHWDGPNFSGARQAESGDYLAEMLGPSQMSTLRPAAPCLQAKIPHVHHKLISWSNCHRDPNLGSHRQHGRHAIA